MYAATSGLDAHQTMLDVAADNLANVDTVGYKRQSARFSEELAQLVDTATSPNGYSAGSDAIQVGLGVQTGSIDNVMSAAGVRTTARNTDVAIDGQGFLRVANGDVSGPAPVLAPTQYTRAGNLGFNQNGYLTTQTGQFVLGYAPQATGAGGYRPVTTGVGAADHPIVVPPGSTQVTIGPDGSVNYVSTAGAAVTAGYISLASFPNEAGLQRDGDSLWSANLSSGSEIPGQPGTGNYGQTIGGELEQSNVDMGSEFIDMIEAERGYQANAGTIDAADRMMRAVVQMKR
ncbi:MAG: flagellar hook-basal body protein [Solirubrobacteraceae bacterium]